jgi:NarL family two-component system response regulator LiaR
MPAEPIRLLLVDDHPLVRRGLQAVLAREPDFEIVGEAEDGDAAVALATDLLPDLVLMDLRLGRVDGIAATAAIRAAAPSVRVLVVSSYEEDEQIFAAIRAGASGYLLKDAPPEKLVMAIRAVAEGYALMSPVVARKVMGEFGRPAPPDRSATAALASLTEREREILTLLGQGRTNREIADELVLAEKTVKTHITNIFSKLHVRERTQAALLAVRSGLVP